MGDSIFHPLLIHSENDLIHSSKYYLKPGAKNPIHYILCALAGALSEAKKQ